MTLAPLGTISTFHANVEQLLRKRLSDELEQQRDTICAGQLEHDRYKYEAGKLAGLLLASTLLEKTVADVMKG